MSPSGCKFILKKISCTHFGHATSMGMLVNGYKKFFLPVLQYTAYILPK